MTTTSSFAPDRLADLSTRAERLRALHQVGNPLVLVNVWDAASARHVEAAGALALATSSAAIAASLGVADDNTMDPEVAFGAVRRIATHTALPVTADLEAGYDLTGPDLVTGVLDAGAVGCNLEDSDHHRPGELIAPHVAADRLHDVRRAARDAGVGLVINARIDTFVRNPDGLPDAVLAETIHRARLYLDAGADCVYPIGLLDVDMIAQLTKALAAPVNANLGRATTVGDLSEAGVSRISIGPMAHRLALDELTRWAALLFSGASGAINPNLG